MKTLNFPDIPSRLNEFWPWFCAVYAFDYADPEPLAELVRSVESIPAEFRAVVADIISGRRLPNKKAAAKHKIPAREHMKIAGTISAVMGVGDAIKYQAIFHTADSAPGAVAVGDYHGVEPAEVLRDVEKNTRELLQDAAADLGVSVETIENLLREMRRRIGLWPTV